MDYTPRIMAQEKSTRSPIVSVLGHVDHGKSSILDAIRETNIVSKEAGEKKAKELDVEYFETSAKTGEHVNDLFYYLGEKIVEKRNLTSAD